MTKEKWKIEVAQSVFENSNEVPREAMRPAGNGGIGHLLQAWCPHRAGSQTRPAAPAPEVVAQGGVGHGTFVMVFFSAGLADPVLSFALSPGLSILKACRAPDFARYSRRL